MIAFLPMLRNMRFPISLFSLLLLIIAGCGGKVILSEDAVRIRKVNDFVSELKTLYEQRDVHLPDLFSQEFFIEKKEVKGAILRDLERFNTISLNLSIDRVEMSGENVKISVQWNGTWKDKVKTYREGGSMVLLASYGNVIRITGIKGDSPFGISRILNTQEK